MIGKPQRRGLGTLGGLVLLATIVVGCAYPPPAGTPPREDPSPLLPTSDGLRLMEIDWDAVPLQELTPAWEQGYAQAVTASVAEDGRSVAAAVGLPDGRPTAPGYELFDDAGQLISRVTFTDRRYRASSVRLLAEGRWVAATKTELNQEGHFSIYDSRGRRLLVLPVQGWAMASGSRDASRLSVLQQPRWGSLARLHLFATDGWRELTSFRVRPDATVKFSTGGRMLVTDADRVFLVAPGGEVLAEYPLPARLRRVVALSPSGERVAATTGGADSRVYLFNQAGERLIDSLLFFGGTNGLTFSQDERWLAVYDVGERGGICLFDLASGELAWRSLFLAIEGAEIRVRNVALDPASRRTVAQVVISRPGPPSIEEHFLYVAEHDGQPLARIFLGTNVEVAMAMSGRVAVVTTNHVADWSGRVRNYVRWYDLGALFPDEPR
ncbi:MAG TPA: hypothetical protein DEQ28_05120 [Clostridiales bacterium]|nr:hypothetical protein [Clostridiales bacterium]